MAVRTIYVGVGATFHDPALAAVDENGSVIFAEATERHLQSKRAYHAAPDSMAAVRNLLSCLGPRPYDLVVGVSWSSQFRTALDTLPLTTSDHDPLTITLNSTTWPFPDYRYMALSMRAALGHAGLNLRSLSSAHEVRVKRFDHHAAHAAHAAWTSPFERCAIAVVDGFGEDRSSACYTWRQGKLTHLNPSAPRSDTSSGSLGDFYSKVCALCGFDPIAGEEWKVMGLAAYGRFDQQLYDLLRPTLGVDHLEILKGVSDADMNDRLAAVRERVRYPDSGPLERADLARTGQCVFEDLMTELLVNLQRQTGLDRLAFAGGCALNSAYNGQITTRTRFDEVHVPSAPADDGTALGAAYLALHSEHPDAWSAAEDRQTPYLGSEITENRTENVARHSAHLCRRLPVDELDERLADLLASGRVVAWIQGRAEFGPRALGNRSILADPRNPAMRDHINSEVKFREEFRPLAPAILDEYGADWFENYQPTPYMEHALVFRPEVRQIVPAVVHVDGTGRVQSVRRSWNPRFYDLIDRFRRRTGVPLLLNTSCNVMGRPIVHSVEDALGVFLTTGIDALVISDLLFEKPNAFR